MIEGFSIHFRFDRNKSGGGVIVYVWDDIPSKQLIKQTSSGYGGCFFKYERYFF